jgi:hypothetical protein
MIEYIFLLYYIPMTIITFYIMEKEVYENSDKFIGFMWSRASIIERVLACAYPIYREIILVMVWYQRKNPRWFLDPKHL